MHGTGETTEAAGQRTAAVGQGAASRNEQTVEVPRKARPITPEIETALDRIADTVQVELLRALQKHPEPFNSAHEGYAVLLEEVEELWEAVKKDDKVQARRECAAVAAMAYRYMMELE